VPTPPPNLSRPSGRPVIVGDETLLPAGVRPGSVVWIVPATEAAPGEVVRVGTDEPPRLRIHDPDDPEPVTGVWFLVQWVP
jgi:hypothetical protein